MTELAVHVKEQDAAVMASIPYLALLTYISGLPRSLPVARTQFLLMMTAADIPDVLSAVADWCEARLLWARFSL